LSIEVKLTQLRNSWRALISKRPAIPRERIKGVLGLFKKKPRDWVMRFTSLQIRLKLIIIIGLVFIGLMTILSLILLRNGQHILQQRLTQTCSMSLRHLSQTIKDDLLLYYSPQSDGNSRSEQLGYIREAVLDVVAEEIDGLLYAGVVDREGVIIAHNNLERINSRIPPEDSTLFTGLTDTHIRESEQTFEYIYPLHARPDANKSIFLGVTFLGFSKKTILNPVRQATQTIITATLLITILAVILVYYIAGRMTRQIDALGEGVRRISSGNLEDRIPVLSRDELGRLAREFNTMITHLREKLQMQKFVSKLTVQMIRDRSTSDLPPVGERRKVTLLFSDVRNFSALTERLAAEEIVTLINIYLDLQSRIVAENKGIVDKFIGDQIMAIFLGEGQADHALYAAIEIQRSIRELNQRRKRREQVILSVGCGLSSGYAVMGNMGSENRLDYTVIGDVVNLAAHLCAMAKPGQIIAPTHLEQELDREIPTIKLEPVRVKGRSRTVPILQVDYDHAIIM